MSCYTKEAMAKWGQELRDAAKKGQLETVNTLLGKTVLLAKLKDDTGKAALHYACGADRDRDKIVSALISAGKKDHVLKEKGQFLSEFLDAITHDWQPGADKKTSAWNPLFFAASKGHIKSVRLLLAAGARVNFATGGSGMMNALILAAKNGHLETVRLLVEEGADISLEGNDGTARNYATKHSRTEVIDALDAAAVEAPNIALRLAAKGGGKAVIRNGRETLVYLSDLLKEGAKVNAADYNGKTALHCAAKGGHTSVASSLIKKGAEVDAVVTKGDKCVGWSPLFYAANEGHNETVRLLLDKGAKVDLQVDKSGGTTALIQAAYKGHLETVRLLLKAGASTTLKDQDGTARENAVKEKHKDIVAALDEWEAVEAPKIALRNAAEARNLDEVNKLLAKGAEVNGATDSGKTALHCAAEGGHTSIATTLLEKGAKVNAVNENGWTALHYACEAGHTEAASLLISNGALVNSQNKKGYTPLLKAATEGWTETVRLLLDKGAIVDIPTAKTQTTALINAASKGHVETVRLLLKAGASTTLKDKDGTARENAVKHNHTDVIAALDEWEAAAEKAAGNGGGNLASSIKVEPKDCKAMVSFNDAASGEDAEALAKFLTEKGVPTFCTRIYCPGMTGSWREVTEAGVSKCKFYVPLMTKGWQRSDECQYETTYAKNRLARKRVNVMPVWYERPHPHAFDLDFDEQQPGHNYAELWMHLQACYRKNDSWKEDVLKCISDSMKRSSASDSGSLAPAA